jgi:lipopolysaccharide exporter
MSDSASLTERGIRAVQWNYVGTIGRALAQVVSLVALARLLGPEPTGLFGYALLLISFVALAVEMGLGAALVQAAKLSREQLASVASRLLLVASCATVMLMLLADEIATTLFETPESAPVLRAIAPSLIVSALSIPAAALLRRELNFRALTLIGLASYVFGYIVVGIGVAFAGGGVWSLVAAWYAQSITACIAMQYRVRGSFALGNPMHLPGLTGFGGIITFTYLLNWVIDSATPFVIGRTFGASSLGAFNVANNLVRTPANHLVTNLQSVLLPASALVQNNLSALRRAYLTALSGVAIIAIPMFGVCSALSHLVIHAVLGERWVVAEPLLTPLALAMIPHSLMAIAGPVLSGAGRPEAELRIQAFVAILLVAALFAASTYGLLALVWVVAGVYLVRFLGMTFALARYTEIGALELFTGLRGGMALAVPAMIIAWSGQHLLADAALVPALKLLGILTVTVIACLCLVMRWPALFLDARLTWLASRMLGSRASLAKVFIARRIVLHLDRHGSR